jgi:hypothetical protein
VFATLPPSAMRLELTRLVSSRLALPESLAETLLAARAGRTVGAQATPGINGAGRRLSVPARGEETERAFLALCIAAPELGRPALESLDVDQHFSSELARRAARRLREGSLHEPLTDTSGRLGDVDEDPELKALLAELIVEAGREQAQPTMLEVQRLQLELGRLDRQIQRARGGESMDVSRLATERAQVKSEFDRAYGRALEETGERD